MKLEDIDLGVRIHNTFAAHGIKTLEQAQALTQADAKRMGLGTRYWWQIERCLHGNSAGEQRHKAAVRAGQVRAAIKLLESQGYTVTPPKGNDA